jgi:glutathione S-transferase
MREIELYLELPARLCYGEAFFGAAVPEAIKAKAEVELRAGFATLKRHAKFAPYVAGDSFTLADIYFLYSVGLAVQVAQKLFQFDPLEDLPQAAALLQQLGENPHVQQIAALRASAMPEFIAHVQGKR